MRVRPSWVPAYDKQVRAHWRTLRPQLRARQCGVCQSGFESLFDVCPACLAKRLRVGGYVARHL